ncbi:PEP-CTERM sorting domain-containing protein [Massilia sp. CFBP9012]|uniref:PEP-CTERM sorting domain-containing protein n=1 Tax=Massilia sp. CFBP9012 TaxID=3096531 RepID=UPI002A69BFCB|nr:PEP-CTERM sorting domain-containing protein [Massilia sp. CFBP9012]MDY0978107.1 PEP-CTERM sorting domain-containing protein [Massilia sp. CFBP9012]
MKFAKQLAATFVLAAAVIAPASANIVVDGSFEAFDGEGAWQTESWSRYVRGTQDGSSSAGTGCAMGSNFGCTLSQTLTTVAGQRYDLSFWLYADGVVDSNGNVALNFDNGLRVWFGDEIVQTIINFPTTNTSGSFNPGGPSTLITISNILATSASTVLQFAGYHNPAGIYLDNVVVEAVPGEEPGEVPEPGTLSLLGLAMGGLALARRRRVRAG